MPNFKEAIVIASFVFLLYSAIDVLKNRMGVGDSIPRWIIGAIASFLAVLLVRFYINY